MKLDVALGKTWIHSKYMLLISTNNAWISKRSEFVVVYSIWSLCLCVRIFVSGVYFRISDKVFCFFFVIECLIIQCWPIQKMSLPQYQCRFHSIVHWLLPATNFPLEFYFVNVFNGKFNFSWMFVVQKHAHKMTHKNIATFSRFVFRKKSTYFLLTNKKHLSGRQSSTHTFTSVKGIIRNANTQVADRR